MSCFYFNTIQKTSDTLISLMKKIAHIVRNIAIALLFLSCLCGISYYLSPSWIDDEGILHEQFGSMFISLLSGPLSLVFFTIFLILKLAKDLEK